MTTISPFFRPVYVMLKPVGSACNMSCNYCYYLEKVGRGVMTETLLEEFIRQYLDCQLQDEILFTWHGGEPTLLPLEFYRKALLLQRKHARGRHIDNCLQTNATLLTDEWCQFLAENNFLVGVSIDGPQRQHDAYRAMKDGSSSFAKVMEGIRLLNKHGVQWNAMAVVNSVNQHEPQAFYRFFRDMGCHFIQFTPIVERRSDGRLLACDEGSHAPGELTPESVTPEIYGRFLCTLFDEWVKEDVGEYFVQLFDATLTCWVRHLGVDVMPGVCAACRRCGNAAVMESNGDVYSCDHFVFPQYKLGNIREHTLTEMLYGEQQNSFGRRKHEQLSADCRSCQWLFACHGGCPKDRKPDGTNRLCQAYRMFFSHTSEWMEQKARSIVETWQ